MFSSLEPGATVQPCPLRDRPPSLHWVEVELVGEDDKPIPSIAYQVRLPTGEIAQGYLDKNGFARIDGIPVAGTCQISFPELDVSAWEFLQTAGPKDANAKSHD